MFQKAIQALECEACGTSMKLIPAGISKKTGNSYSAFWSCPNNLNCGGKTRHYEEPTPAPKPPQKSYNEGTDDIPVVDKPPLKTAPLGTRDEIILERLDDLSTKMDIIIKEIIPEQ